MLKSGIVPTLIDFSTPLRTLLPTGGGRCNLAHSEFDFKELAKNYPRGEKFLYSVFSKFGTSETLEMFEDIGVETYTQENERIFPLSNSSKEVQDKFFSAIKQCKIIKEKALRIEKNNHKFKVVTDMNSYQFDKLVYSVGGHSGYNMIKRIGITIVEPKPSLVGLVTSEKFADLMGITLKNVINNETGISDDMLFTHFGISGPLIYTVSSIYARREFPYQLSFNICPDLDKMGFQQILNDNPHKLLKNVLSEFVPHKFAEFLLTELELSKDLKSHKVDGEMRDLILNTLNNFSVNIKSAKKDGETVTSGRVSLDKINPKTMESKEIPDLYFCGEVTDIDGFCGGFNLQNCWSTAFVASQGLCESIK